jgi:tetratricopeptide (TPR) repeat protein
VKPPQNWLVRAAIVWITFSVFAYAADSLRDQIVAAQSSGNYAEAANLYLKLIASGDDGPEIRSNCGVMLHLAGRNREAVEQFHVALRQQPEMAGANLFAGISELDLGELKAALPYLTKAQQLDPNRPAPLLALAKLYVALRQYQRANELYAKAVALDAQLAEAWYGLGVTDRSLAEELLNQKGGLRDQRVQHLLNDAVQALTRAVELDPNSARTHLLMAESLSDAGKVDEATLEFNAAIKLDPQLDAATLGLATAYWKEHEFGHALPLLQRLLEKSPKDPEVNAMMSDLLEHNSDFAGAQQHAQIAVAGNPTLIQPHVVLARVYLARQQPQLAITELRKVIAADPDGGYHFLLYRAFHQTGDEKNAKAAMAEFQKIRYSKRKPPS